MEPTITIVFATDSCGYRSLWDFVLGFAIILIGVTASIFTGARRGPSLVEIGAFPAKMDRLAIYSLGGLVTGFVAAMAFGGAMRQTPTKLVASGNQIEVTGCRMARPFTSTFDRSQMSTTYLIREGNVTDRYLVLRQKEQRKVEFRLGDYAIDRKLAVLAPEAMKLYFAEHK